VEKPSTEWQKSMTNQSNSAIILLQTAMIEPPQANKKANSIPRSIVELSDVTLSSVSEVGGLAKAIIITPPKHSAIPAYSKFLIVSDRKITARIDVQNGAVYTTVE